LIFLISRCVTKIKKCAGFSKANHFLKVPPLLSPTRIIFIKIGKTDKFCGHDTSRIFNFTMFHRVFSKAHFFSFFKDFFIDFTQNIWVRSKGPNYCFPSIFFIISLLNQRHRSKVLKNSFKHKEPDLKILIFIDNSALFLFDRTQFVFCSHYA
jgi:hypothetical protein